MTTESKVVLGLAAATLAGVAIGLLAAPNSGEETRSKIRKQTNKLTNRLLDVIESGQSMVSENVDAITGKVKSAYDQAKGTYDQAKGMVKSEANRVKHQVEDMA